MANTGGFSVSVGVIDQASTKLATINKTIAKLQNDVGSAGKSVATLGDTSGVSRLSEGMASLGERTLGAARAAERLVPGMQVLTGAASLAGIAALTRNWADAGNSIGKTANLLNTPVEKLGNLHIAARLAGSSADVMDSSLKGLNDTLSNAYWARPGSGGSIALLNQYGIGFKGVAGQARTAEDALGDVFDAIASQHGRPDTQRRLLEQFGMSPDLLPFADKGRKGLEEFTKKAEATGGAMTKGMVDSATKMKSSWEELGAAVEGVDNRIINSWSGTVTKVLDGTAHWIENNKGLADSWGELGVAASALMAGTGFLKLLAMLGVPGAAAAGAVVGAAGGLSLVGAASGIMRVPMVDDYGRVVGNWGGADETANPAYGGIGSRTAPMAAPRAYIAPRHLVPLGPGGGNALDSDTVARAMTIHDGLVKRGMDSDTAWGFAGNAVQESRAMWNSRPGDMGAAHGAFMWRDDRLAAYQRRYGHLPEQGSLDEQLDFVMNELGGSEANAWKAIQFAPGGPAGKGAAVSQFYERPKDTQDEIDRRSSLSERLATQGSVHVTVDVRHNGTAATATAVAAGAATASPPRVETAMPYSGGP